MTEVGQRQDAARRLAEIAEIRKLEETGVLSRELFPEPDYWHWDVLQPDKLPERFSQCYKEFGEIRW